MIIGRRRTRRPLMDSLLLIDGQVVRSTPWVALTKLGVPPFGHSTQLRVFVDPDLLRYDEVWAAAGTWNSYSVGRRFEPDPPNLLGTCSNYLTYLKFRTALREVVLESSAPLPVVMRRTFTPLAARNRATTFARAADSFIALAP